MVGEKVAGEEVAGEDDAGWPHSEPARHETAPAGLWCAAVPAYGARLFESTGFALAEVCRNEAAATGARPVGEEASAAAAEDGECRWRLPRCMSLPNKQTNKNLQRLIEDHHKTFSFCFDLTTNTHILIFRAYTDTIVRFAT